jgi:hypothetical protein
MSLAAGLPIEWLNGRKELGLFRNFYSAGGWHPFNVFLVVIAIVLGGVASNLLATMISEHGWAGAFARYPTKATVYAGLVVASALTTTIVVTR